MSNLLPLSMACGDYDRTEALRTGEVSVEGATLTCLTLGPEETFFRMVKYREFDVATSPFIAIPIFLSRIFRHNSIYVNASTGIESPKDLIGSVVGVPEYPDDSCGLDTWNPCGAPRRTG